MLSSRPVIFISAVSKELHSTRDLVAKTLVSLGYEPKWQDIAPTETGDLRGVLRKWVDQSHAVIQIVGHRYGYGPKSPDPDFGQISYTQYETLYAHQKGKPVWYIILDENHPVDLAGPESAELCHLQECYRIQVRAHGNLYHPSADLLHTENIVLRLRDDLAKLRRRARQWAILILTLLLLALGGLGWSLVKQKDAGKKINRIEQRTTEVGVEQKRQTEAIKKQTEVISKLDSILREAVREVPAALAEAKYALPHEDEVTRSARVYAGIEKNLKLPIGTLNKELPAFTKRLLDRTDISEIERANSNFANKQFDEAEEAAMRARDQALAAGQPVREVIAALVLAGQSASEQLNYKRAVAHYGEAAKFAMSQGDVLRSAFIKNEIGWLLGLDGLYAEETTLMSQAWQEGMICKYPPAITLRSHYLWADALYHLGEYAAAEQQFRVLLAGQESLLGWENPDTLISHKCLADALTAQGKDAEAEQEIRALLVSQEHALGPEDNNTLLSCYNLGICLEVQGKTQEAILFAGRAWAGWTKIFGEEDPNSKNAKAVVERLESK